jgi:hypothetical protein
MLRFRPLLVSSLALAACTDLTAPGSLQVSVRTSRAVIAPGDTTQITVTVRNLSAKPVTFNSNCTISFQVRPVGDTTNVANRGPIFCLAFIDAVTLGPLESYTSGFRWNAMRRLCQGTTCAAVPVPAGDYRLTGSLDGLVSPAVPLTVR